MTNQLMDDKRQSIILTVTSRYPALTYFLICYIFSWGVWLLGFLPDNVFYFGPAFAAIVVTALHSGKAGLRDLLAQLFRWRVAMKWYLLAIFLAPVTLMLVTGLNVLADNLASDLPDTTYWLVTFPPILATLVFFSLLLMVFTAIEEIGWRGYALPALQQKYHPLIASAIIGFFWGIWHLPVFLGTSTNNTAMDLVIFTWMTICVSVFYTWLYNSTVGSVLLTSIFHSAYNTTVGFASAIVPFKQGTRHDMVALVVITLLVMLIGGLKLGYKQSDVNANPASD